ncbi:MAG: DUF362 domain-containing protein [Clostridia bacterium]|nr:DUF362 domain-containing protein [Clostridia bacterium]
MKQTVSFYACDSYEDRAALKRAVLSVISDCGGFDALFDRGRRVVVKPNLVMKKSPEGAATTHPALMDVLLEILLEYTRDIRVVECPGGPGTPALVEAIYRTTGIREVCDRRGVEIVVSPEARTVTVEGAKVASALSLAGEMVDADVFINLGKLKSHSLTTFTGCAKNLYGAIVGLTKVEYHARFAQLSDFANLICDINRALVPTLNLLDAVVGMEGNGPTGGTARKIGGIVGGNNAFAVDAIGARLIGLREEEAPILSAARALGLYTPVEECLGDDYAPFVQSDFLFADAQRFSILREMPNLKFLRRFLEPRPVISSRCVGCGECVRLCPKSVIELRTVKGKKRAYIHKNKCIRCYCCQELCPAKAVDTKSRKILKI